MVQQLRELIREAKVQQALKSAITQADAVLVLLTASAEKGLRYTAEGISQALASLTSGKAGELSEEELLAVSGGMRCCESQGMSGSAHYTVDNCGTTGVNCNPP